MSIPSIYNHELTVPLPDTLAHELTEICELTGKSDEAIARRCLLLGLPQIRAELEAPVITLPQNVESIHPESKPNHHE